MGRPPRAADVTQENHPGGRGFYHRAVSLQPNEVLIIVLVALIVLGPKRLPGAIRGIGRAFRQVRDFSTTVRQEMDATLSPPIIEPADPPAKPRPSSEAELAADPAASSELAPTIPAVIEQATDDSAQASPPEPSDGSVTDRPTSDGSA